MGTQKLKEALAGPASKEKGPPVAVCGGGGGGCGGQEVACSSFRWYGKFKALYQLKRRMPSLAQDATQCQEMPGWQFTAHHPGLAEHKMCNHTLPNQMNPEHIVPSNVTSKTCCTVFDKDPKGPSWGGRLFT